MLSAGFGVEGSSDALELGWVGPPDSVGGVVGALGVDEAEGVIEPLLELVVDGLDVVVVGWVADGVPD